MGAVVRMLVLYNVCERRAALCDGDQWGSQAVSVTQLTQTDGSGIIYHVGVTNVEDLIYRVFHF